MAFWLYKSEPFKWSWEMQKAKGDVGEEWTGVRNYLARNNMRAMQPGDWVFFYHSNIGLEIVGICKVCKLAHPDSTSADDPRWDCVWIKAVKPLQRPISLEECKVTPGLEQMVLINNSRLSVQPVTAEEWQIICRLGGVV